MCVAVKSVNTQYHNAITTVSHRAWHHHQGFDEEVLRQWSSGQRHHQAEGYLAVCLRVGARLERGHASSKETDGLWKAHPEVPDCAFELLHTREHIWMRYMLYMNDMWYCVGHEAIPMLGFHVRDIYAERGPISGVQQDGGSWEYHGKAVHVHLSTHSNMQVTDTRPPPPPISNNMCRTWGVILMVWCPTRCLWRRSLQLLVVAPMAAPTPGRRQIHQLQGRLRPRQRLKQSSPPKQNHQNSKRRR